MATMRRTGSRPVPGCGMQGGMGMPPGTRAPARSGAWTARWLELTLLAAALAVVLVCLTHVWAAPLELVPLLAVVPALAGIGALGFGRPLAYGVLALLAGVVVDALVRGGITATGPAHALPLAAIGATAVVTALSAAGAVLGAHSRDTRQVQKDERFLNVTSVAEAAQRAVLRQLPETIGPLGLGVVYQAAAAEARVGGDLYEVADTEHGIRLIIGDVRGKGLGAVEVAADVVGRFRELAYSVHTLDEIAYRLDAGLSRRFGPQEEFVTALLVQVDPRAGRLTIVNCGHPPPLLISAAHEVTVLEVRAPAPPLGLLTLGSEAGAKDTRLFPPHAQLLLYTDGVTEARDAGGAFYPLGERVAVLAAQSPPWTARLGRHAGPTLLDLVRDDLLRHVGSPPHDDAAMLVVRAPAAWAHPPRPRAGGRVSMRTEGP
jgi:serine phosphatase RsbU (regulator of sigma subunit)